MDSVVYPHNEILLSNEKEQITDICKNMDDSQMNYAKWKGPDSKG